MMKKGLWAVMAACVLLCSCREEFRHFDQGEVWLDFSQDTIRFDTILSTQATITKTITVRNPSDKAVRISRVYLAGGASSRFRFNLNGNPASDQRDLVLGGKDSLYLFVQAVIDYRNRENPFEVIDYIRFELNDMKPQQVVLSAWGQDAHYWVGKLSARVPYEDPLDGTYYAADSLSFRYFLWNETDYPIAAGRPYVIYGYLTVPAGKTLAIPAGVRMYFASNSGIWLQAGARLEIAGALNNPVVMTSMRQDGNYRHMAGQWGRIWLDSASGPHSVEYALIRNAQSAFWVESGCALNIDDTRIENMSRHGILAKNAQVNGINLCISETQLNLCLSRGGSYAFTHCTFANDFYGGMIGVYNRCLYLSDHNGKDAASRETGRLERAMFNNSIFYGRNSSQIETDLQDAASREAFRFTRCLINQYPPLSGPNYDSCRWNENPFFVNADAYDFDIDTIASAAVGRGSAEFVQGKAMQDLKGRARALPPTIGAYEFQAKKPTVLIRVGKRKR